MSVFRLKYDKKDEELEDVLEYISLSQGILKEIKRKNRGFQISS